MSVYLKIFDTHTQYQANENDLKLPNVSYCKQERDSHFKAKDYSKEYFRLIITKAGTLNIILPKELTTTMFDSLLYSINDGKTWEVIQNSDRSTASISLSSVNVGQIILLKGSGNQVGASLNTRPATYTHISFGGTAEFSVDGNIMSLLLEDNFISYDPSSDTSDIVCRFYGLFENSNIVNAKNLVINTKLSNNCYNHMFYGCTKLINAPSILPATTLTGAMGCYQYMFYGCTSLITAPELPATTLVSSCYQYMFYGCTSLTKAPVLPALTLISYCYRYMFQNCSSLKYIKALFTTNIIDNTSNNVLTSQWVNGVSATGTFIKNKNATWNVVSANGVPEGWTIKTI